MMFILKRKLNNFALFECLKDEEGKKLLTEMYESYLKVGQDNGVKTLCLTPTWRASELHMTGMGYEASDVEKYNVMGAEFMLNFAKTHPGADLIIGG